MFPNPGFQCECVCMRVVLYLFRKHSHPNHISLLQVLYACNESWCLLSPKTMTVPRSICLYRSSTSGRINHQIALQLFCLVLRTSYPCQTLQTAIHNIPKREKKKASSGSHIGSSFSNKWLLISISKGFTDECWNRVMSSGVTGRILKQRTASPLIITETVYPGTAVTNSVSST